MTLLAADYPTLSAEMLVFLSTAPSEDIAEAYCESYKDAHGIKARWMLGAVKTPAEWAASWVQLGHALEAEFAREDAEKAAFKAKIASLGLTEWAERNGIYTEYDLMEHNQRKDWEAHAA